MGSKNKQKIINDFLKENYTISENKIELYNIFMPIIFSKKIFKNGKELQCFLKEELDIEYANYVFKSRTLLAGKIAKFLNGLSIEEAVSLNRKVTEKLANIIEGTESNEIQNDKYTSKKREKSLFTLWSEHIENSN